MSKAKSETYSDRLKKWKAIEKGEMPDDYTNAFLSRMGFHDDTRKWDKEQARRKAYEADAAGGVKINQSSHNGFNSQD